MRSIQGPSLFDKSSTSHRTSCINSVNPTTAVVKTTTATASTKVESQLNTDDFTHGSSPHPIELDGNPVPSRPETNAIKPSDTTKQTTNKIVSDDKMSEDEESDDEPDWFKPPPGWRASDEWGWMDHLMPSPEDRILDMMLDARSTGETATVEKKLDIMLGILDRHNTMLRGVVYVGAMLFLFFVLVAIGGAREKNHGRNSALLFCVPRF